MKPHRFIFILLLLFSFSAFSQAPAKKKKKKMTGTELDSLEKANFLYDEQEFLDALPIYDRLLGDHPDDPFLKYRTGVCCLYRTDAYDKALTLLNEVIEKNKKAADIKYYLGRANMMNYKFDEAIALFTEYLKQKKIPGEYKTYSNEYIRNCTNGKELVAHPVDVKISNIGPPINTEASEYVPVISSDESVLIFTYRGKKSTGGLQKLGKSDKGEYYEDVYISEKKDGKWDIPVSAGDSINTVGHDACIAISNDGQKLFIYKDNPIEGKDIYMSTLSGKTWSVPKKLKGDVNTDEYWEGSCSLSPNEQILYFSSERPGGYGGRDLYRATLQPDGSWGDVKNLGPNINTEYDDDAPFIHPDGTTLIFSSKGHNSMGGYDIFKCTRTDTGWSKPENIGFPINTPGDDIYYVLSADGQRGYYSSGKPGGYGQQDIYVTEPGMVGKKPALVMLKGTITFNDDPTQVQIEVLYANDEVEGRYRSNSSTGKYLINLPAGSNYKVVYKKDGYGEQMKLVNATGIDSYTEMTNDVDFFDKLTLTMVDTFGNVLGTGTQLKYKVFKFEYIPTDVHVAFVLEGKTADSLNTIFISISGNNVKIIRGKDRKFRFEKFPPEGLPLTALKEHDVPLRPPGNYKDLVKMYGDVKAKGLVFKVQVGAYRKPENAKLGNLKVLGKLEQKKYDDELTRFTIGNYQTLKQADKMLDKVLAKGTTDAFVTAFMDGKRFYLKDLATLQKK